ncbi:MAG: efflux RND transporter periplasmic adaptor subunit [Acidobacteriia bacterium]|nr:efflux RND transporter periplasmic adaptor subunit [Terriglobia bacterium]
MKKVIRWIVTVIVLGGLTAGGVWLYRTAKVEAKADLPVAVARRGEFQVIVRCRGELVSTRSAQLIAPVNVPGMVIAWLAAPNSEVKAGDAVVRFDSSSVQQQLLEKQAALDQAQASLDQAVAQARMNAEQDKIDLTSAQVEVERARLEVSKQEIVSRLQGEESKIDLDIAQEKLRVEEATVNLHQKSDAARIGSQTRLRDKAQQDVDVTKERIGKMEVKAPSSGVIVYLNNYSQGWMNAKPFKVGDQVWPGSGIAEIPDLSTLAMKGKLEETDRGRISTGMDVRMQVDPFPEKNYPGKLSAISPLVEQTFDWPPTRNFRAVGSFSDRDTRLRPGMNGRLDIIIERLPDAISIPSNALFTRLGRPAVYIENGAGWTPKEVEVLARNPDEVAIKGVDAGTKVSLVEPDAQGKIAAKKESAP